METVAPAKHRPGGLVAGPLDTRRHVLAELVTPGLNRTDRTIVGEALERIRFLHRITVLQAKDASLRKCR